jgi:hypothetical protein
MTFPRNRTLITVAVALSIGYASAAAAAESHRASGELPMLPVVTVTPDAADLARAAGRGLPLLPMVTVTPDAMPAFEPLPGPLARERVADGRVLPRLPTIEVAATVAPVEPEPGIAAREAVEPVAVGEAQRGTRFVIRGASSVRFVMPYYSFGNRTGGVEP